MLKPGWGLIIEEIVIQLFTRNPNPKGDDLPWTNLQFSLRDMRYVDTNQQESR